MGIYKDLAQEDSKEAFITQQVASHAGTNINLSGAASGGGSVGKELDKTFLTPLRSAGMGISSLFSDDNTTQYLGESQVATTGLDLHGNANKELSGAEEIAQMVALGYGAGRAIQGTEFITQSIIKGAINTTENALNKASSIVFNKGVNTINKGITTGNPILRQSGYNAISTSKTLASKADAVRAFGKGSKNLLTGEGNSLGKRITLGLADEAWKQSTYAAAFTAPALAETRVNGKGEIESKYNFDHAGEVFSANLAFAAVPTAIARGVGASGRYMAGRKVMNGTSSNKYTALNLDQDGVLALNNTILKETGGNIKDANGKTVEIQTYNGGFISLEDFNTITGAKYKSAHEIKSGKEPYAVVDAEGNFAINTVDKGNWKGVVNADGSNKIIFNEKSNIARSAAEMKYAGKRLLEAVKDENVNITKRSFKTSKQEYTSPKQAFEWKRDGTIGDSALAKDTRRRIGQKDINRYAENDPVMQVFNSAIKAGHAPKFFEEAEGVTLNKRDNNIISQLLLAEDIPHEFIATLEANPATEQIAKLIKYAADSKGKLSTEFDLSNFTIKDTSPENLATYKKFFKTRTETAADGSEQVVVTDFKNEFKQALDSGYALALAKYDDATLMNPSSLKRASMQEAFNLMGAKPSVKEDMLKQDILSRAREGNDMPLEGKTSKTLDDNAQLVNGSEMLPRVSDLVDSFGADASIRAYNINDILTHGVANENGGMILTGKRGKVFSKIADKNSPLVKEHENNINAMLDTEFYFMPDSKILVNNLTKLTEGASPYGGNRLTANEKQLATLFNVINHKELKQYESGKWLPHEKENLWKEINEYRQEILMAKKAMEHQSETGIGIRFDVEFDPHLRPRYKGLFSPQASKLARVLLSTEDRVIDLKDPVHNELATRATLANFGIKVEGIHDFATVESIFAEMKNKLLVLDNGKYKLNKAYALDGDTGLMLDGVKFAKAIDDGSLEFTVDGKKYDIDTEGAISFGGINNIIDMANKKPTINVFAEIDSKMSGTALTFARLGYKDPRLGLGSKIDTSLKDPYNELAEAFGGAITRQEAKPILNGFNYESSIFTAAKSGVESMLKTWYRGGELPKLLSQHIVKWEETSDKIVQVIKKQNKTIAELDELASKDLAGMSEEARNAHDLRKRNLENDLKNTDAWLRENEQQVTALNGLRAIKKGEPLTKEAQEAIANKLANDISKQTDAALTKLYEKQPLIKRFRDDTAATIEHVNQEFNYRYFDKKYTRDTAVKKLIESAKQASGEDISVEYANKILAAKDSYSIHDIVDTLARNDMFRRNIHDIQILEDIIPYIELGNGKRVPIVAPQGYMGYSEGVNYPMPATSNIFTPLFTIGTDAAIMDAALKPGLTSIFDALVGGKSLYSSVKEMNKHFAGLTAINPYDQLLKLHKEYVGQHGGDLKIKDKVWRNIATAQLLSKGKKAMPEAVDKLAAELKVNDIYGAKAKAEEVTFIEQHNRRLGRGLEDTKKNISENGFKDNDIIANHSDGSNHGIITYGERAKYELSSENKAYTEYDNEHSVTLAKMESVEPNGDTSMVVHLDDYATGKPTKTKDVRLLTEAEDNAYAQARETSGGHVEHIVATTHKEFTPAALDEITHEIVHVEIASSYEPFLTQLQETLLRLSHEEMPNGNPRFAQLKADGTYEKFANVSDANILTGEVVSDTIGKLYKNDLLMKNKDKFANLFSKDGKPVNLKDELTTFLYDGNAIYTTKDLMTMLKKDGLDADASLVHRLVNGMNSTLNGSEDILAFINGKSRHKFNSVMADAEGSIKWGRNLVNKANEKVGLMNATDIFSLTAHDEAVQTAISQVKVADNILLETMAKYGEKLQPLVDHPSNPKFAQRIGNAALVGVQRFMKDLQKATTSKEYITAVKNRMLTSRENMKSIFTRNTLASIEKFIQDKYGSNLKPKDIEKAVTKILKKEYGAKPQELLDKHAIVKNYIYDSIAANRITSMSDVVHNLFNDLTRPELKQNAETLLNKFNGTGANKNTLFGTNPQINFAENHIKGVAVKAVDYTKSKGIIARFKASNGEAYVLVEKESLKDIVGAQKSQQMEVNLNPAMEGLYKVKVKDLKETIYITPENIIGGHKAVDSDVVTQLKRNMYVSQYADIVNEAAFREFEKLRDAGVLMSQAKFESLPKEVREQYERRETSKGKYEKTPFDKTFGKFYYNKKYAKYFGGSKGFDIGKKNMTSIFGGAGGLISGMAKTVIGATAILKGPILIMRPASYVNSLASNMLIYAINSDDAMGAGRRYAQARTEIASFKTVLNKAVQDVIDGKPHKEAWKAVEDHTLWTAYKHGIHSTIRTSAFETSAYAENMVYTSLNKLTKNEQLSDGLKFLTFDASTKHGNAMGKLFDATEMVPKVMMYLAKRDQLGNAQLAAQHVLLAYPTYNNLGMMLNGIDQFSPFTKYMVNYPKMFIYAATMNPRKFVGMNALFFAAVRASFGTDIDPDEEFWYNNDFVDVGFGYKSIPSLDSYILPHKGIAGEGLSIDTIATGDFIPSALNTFSTGKFLNVATPYPSGH